MPVVTDEVRRDYLPAVPLPAGLQPVTPAALLGRWGPKPAPAADDGRRPYVEFRDAGRWTGSDGCNGLGGRWAAGPAGSFIATAGSSTLIGCDNVSVQVWMDGARRAGFDRNVLVLLDDTGNVVGRLYRIGGAKAPTSRPAPGP